MIEESVQRALDGVDPATAGALVVQFSNFPRDLIAAAKTPGERLKVAASHMQQRLSELLPAEEMKGVTVRHLEGVGQTILEGSAQLLTKLVESSGPLAKASDIRVRPNMFMPAPNEPVSAP